MGLRRNKETDGQELADAIAQRTAAGGPTSGPPAAPTPGVPRKPEGGVWTEEKESTGRSAARTAGRVVLWLVLGVFVVAGARSIILPPLPPEAPPQTDSEAAAKDDVPVDEARQVAERFGRAYLTWSEKAASSRATELARDLPEGADTKMGWNGLGDQGTSQAVAGAVVQTSPHRAQVLVDVKTVTAVTENKQTRNISRWRTLRIPVAQTGGRVLVTGQPALVGTPKPGKYEQPSPPEADLALSQETRKSIEEFLSAWAQGREAQAAAPGAALAPLGGGVRLERLDSWTVHAGSGDKRTGTAVVTWNFGRAQLQQTYLITLTQVTTGAATRWQVLNASTP
ncbi:conjugal transfer protein [Streptomyces erythrochromogenes]|uniref:conjugal transfer protein n=1 Tax=Streptomyces erythrochromogenes TaxID=285574 RepID=UPI00343B6EEC